MQRQLRNKLSYCYRMLTCHLSSRVTYVKKLDTVTSVNSHAITNLSGILKDVSIKSEDNFKQITRDILWLNITMYNYSELFVYGHTTARICYTSAYSAN
jgi:hypothetical protein